MGGEGAAINQRVAGADRVAEEAQPIAQQPRGPGRVRIAPPIGLAQPGERGEEESRPGEAERDEDRRPAERHQEMGAENRRDQRRHRHHHGDVGEHLRAARPMELVAHHGGAQGAADRGAEPLDETADDQRRHRGAEGAGKPAQRVDGEPAEQHRAATETVGKRPEPELGEREADEEDAERELRLVGGGVEGDGERRQRRQAHVDRQRGERGQRAEQGHEAPRSGGQPSRQAARLEAGRERFVPRHARLITAAPGVRRCKLRRAARLAVGEIRRQR